MGIVVAFLIGLGVIVAAERSPTVQKETERVGKQIEKKMERFTPKK